MCILSLPPRKNRILSYAKEGGDEMKPICPIIQNSKLASSTDRSVCYCQFPFLKKICEKLQVNCICNGHCIIKILSQDTKRMLVHHIADNELSTKEQNQLTNELLTYYKPSMSPVPSSHIISSP